MIPAESGAATDSFDSVFEEKTSRLVWIVPSVLLHVVVITLWVMFPGKREEVKPGERKLTVRSEQAQQLKEFVEDANISELRTELSELQGIKAAMAKIRDEKLAELKKFEVGLRSEIPGDLNDSVAKTLKSASMVSEKDAAIGKELQELASFERAYLPALEAGNFAGALPPLKKASEAWKRINEARDDASLEAERLGQVVSQLENLMQWVEMPEAQAAWQAFSGQCKAAIDQQNKSSNDVWSLYDSYDKELNELAANLNAQELFLKGLAEKEKQGVAEYEAAKTAMKSQIEDMEKKEKEAQDKLVRLQEEAKKLQGELDALKKEVAKMPSKSEADKKAKAEKSAEIKPKEQAAGASRKDISDQQILIRKIAQEQGALKKKLEHLPPWKVAREDEAKAAQIAKMREKVKTVRCNVEAMKPAVAALEGLKTASSQLLASIGKLPKPSEEAAKQ